MLEQTPEQYILTVREMAIRTAMAKVGLAKAKIEVAEAQLDIANFALESITKEMNKETENGNS